MPTPDQTLANFFNVFTAGNARYRDIQYLINQVFSGSPKVGLASNSGPAGPFFNGKNNVEKLFTQMIGTMDGATQGAFHNLTFTQIPPVCSDSGGDTKIVQAMLDTDNQTGPWFDQASGFYSRPLSDVVPKGKRHRNKPTCMVFTFNANGLIDQLGIYIDRWQLALDLWDGTHPAHLA